MAEITQPVETPDQDSSPNLMFPDCVPVFTVEKLTLRAHCDADIRWLVEQCRDELSQNFVPLPSPYSEDDARSFLNDFVKGGWESSRRFEFAIDYDGRFAGNVGVADRGSGRYEIGWLIHPRFRGLGTATAAARRVLEWVFTERGAAVAFWKADAENHASAAVARKLGFTDHVLLRNWLPLGEDLRDALMATMTHEEFRVHAREQQEQ